MALVLKLLVVVVGCGLAVKFGVLDQLGLVFRDAALQSGLSQEQWGAASSQAQSLLSLNAIAVIMDSIGTLPSPFGAIGKLLFLLTILGVAVSLVAGAIAYTVRTLRWVRDLAI